MIGHLGVARQRPARRPAARRRRRSGPGSTCTPATSAATSSSARAGSRPAWPASPSAPRRRPDRLKGSLLGAAAGLPPGDAAARRCRAAPRRRAWSPSAAEPSGAAVHGRARPRRRARPTRPSIDRRAPVASLPARADAPDVRCRGGPADARTARHAAEPLTPATGATPGWRTDDRGRARRLREPRRGDPERHRADRSRSADPSGAAAATAGDRSARSAVPPTARPPPPAPVGARPRPSPGHLPGSALRPYAAARHPADARRHAVPRGRADGPGVPAGSGRSVCVPRAGRRRARRRRRRRGVRALVDDDRRPGSSPAASTEVDPSLDARRCPADNGSVAAVGQELLPSTVQISARVPRAGGRRDRLRLRARPAGPHHHQQPRRRGRRRGRRADRDRRPGRQPLRRRRSSAAARSTTSPCSTSEDARDLRPAVARRLAGAARRRRGRRVRLAARAELDRHRRHRQRARPPGDHRRLRQRLVLHQRRADRRRDQPRQLRRPAGRPPGQVVGVNSAIATTGGAVRARSGNIGVGFAIPIEQVRITADQILRTGEARYPVIGAKVQTGGDRRRGRRDRRGPGRHPGRGRRACRRAT